MYEIHLSNQSEKFIKSLDSKKKQQIKEVLELLKNDPFHFPYKKLVGVGARYRIRKGTFRISYNLNNNELIIQIIKIGKRENFYN